MIIARKIAYNVIVSSVSKILSTILALVSIGLITRYLGKEGFGNYATVLAFLSFFSAISDLGLYQTTTREISRPSAREADILGRSMSLRITASFIIVLLSPLIIWFFPYPIEVKQAVVIISLSFLFSSAYQILNGLFQKNLAMDKVAISELLGKALQVLIVFLAVRADLGFLWIISAILFNMIFSFVLIFLFSKKYLTFKITFDFRYWRNFLKISYPLGISAFIGFIYFKLDTILLSILKTSADVGIYSAAYKVIENIIFFPAMLIGLIFPILSQSIFSDKARFKDISDKTFKVFWICIIPLIIAVQFLSDDIIALIGGAGFGESAVVLRILVFSLAAIFFSNFSNSILIAGNKQKKLLFATLLAAVFNISLNLFFIPIYSYMGAAVISVMTEILVVALTWRIVLRDIKYVPHVEKFWGILVAGGAMAGYLAIFHEMNFFLLAISSTLIYAVCLWLFRTIKTEELISIIGKNKLQNP